MQRPGLPGEMCTCGKQAKVVFTYDDHETGWCGVENSMVWPCPFCGAMEHFGRCTQYTLRGNNA